MIDLRLPGWQVTTLTVEMVTGSRYEDQTDRSLHRPELPLHLPFHPKVTPVAIQDGICTLPIASQSPSMADPPHCEAVLWRSSLIAFKLCPSPLLPAELSLFPICNLT